MNTLEMLDAAKKMHSIRSDYELARTLDCSTAQISQYRTKKRTMDDYTAARIAELLGIDEMLVIAQANAEREKDEAKREFWKNKAAAFFEHATGARKLAQTFYNI